MRAQEALGWTLRYVRRPRWDRGRIDPVVREWVEAAPPSRALDVGCGTGLYTRLLAGAGHDALGVDVSLTALLRARWRARGTSARFAWADVADLSPGQEARYRLLVDVGCLHSLPSSRHAAYLAGVTRAATSRATWILLAVEPGVASDIPGVDPVAPAGWAGWTVLEQVRTAAPAPWRWPISITRLSREP